MDSWFRCECLANSAFRNSSKLKIIRILHGPQWSCFFWVTRRLPLLHRHANRFGNSKWPLKTQTQWSSRASVAVAMIINPKSQHGSRGRGQISGAQLWLHNFCIFLQVFPVLGLHCDWPCSSQVVPSDAGLRALWSLSVGKKHEKTHAQMQLLNSSPKFQITEVTGVVTVKGSLFLTELNGRSVLKTLRCLQSCTVPRQGSRNWGSETEFRITYFLSQFSYSWGLGCFGYQFKSFGPSGVLELHGRTCRHTGETFGNSEKNYRGKRPQM